MQKSGNDADVMKCYVLGMKSCTNCIRIVRVLYSHTHTHFFVLVVNSLACYTCDSGHLPGSLSYLPFLLMKNCWDYHHHRTSATSNNISDNMNLMMFLLHTSKSTTVLRQKRYCHMLLRYFVRFSCGCCQCYFLRLRQPKKGTERVMMIQIQFSQPFTFCHLSTFTLSIDSVLAFCYCFFFHSSTSQPSCDVAVCGDVPCTYAFTQNANETTA